MIRRIAVALPVLAAALATTPATGQLDPPLPQQGVSHRPAIRLETDYYAYGPGVGFDTPELLVDIDPNGFSQPVTLFLYWQDREGGAGSRRYFNAARRVRRAVARSPERHRHARPSCSSPRSTASSSSALMAPSARCRRTSRAPPAVTCSCSRSATARAPRPRPQRRHVQRGRRRGVAQRQHHHPDLDPQQPVPAGGPRQRAGRVSPHHRARHRGDRIEGRPGHPDRAARLADHRRRRPAQPDRLHLRVRGRHPHRRRLGRSGHERRRSSQLLGDRGRLRR